jgi:hypothetical protein
MQPELAGKIVGMLLEVENAVLVILMEDDYALRAEVDHALTICVEYIKTNGVNGNEADYSKEARREVVRGPSSGIKRIFWEP